MIVKEQISGLWKLNNISNLSFINLKTMKTLKNTFLLMAVFCMILSFSNCNLPGSNKGKDTVRMTTIPFAADALGEYIYVGPDTLQDQKCNDSLSAWRAIVNCKGTGTPIGHFTGYFDFCGDADSHYGNAFAYLVAENGDTLYIDASGQVIDGKLDEHPAFVVSYWKDKFEITGGTGKYRGATGSITTNDYNSSEDMNSHHHWEGTITMPEEKNK